MSDLTRAILSSWTIDPWPLTIAVVSILIYWRGWRGLSRSQPTRFTRWRLVSFITGIAVCWIAIASPLDAFGSLLLEVHMGQHVLLMMIGPPLILLAYPGIPLLRGLPGTIRREWCGPFLASAAVRRGFHVVTHPITGLSTFIIATWVWHLPVLYEAALQDRFWHEVEHGVFLGTALLFWWPVIQPWPSTPVWPRWMLLPYLLLADLQNTVFSAIFVYIGTPIYTAYAASPDLFGISTLNDQSAAGAIMWVAGSAAFLLPVGLCIRQLLQPRLVTVQAGQGGPRLDLPLPIIGEPEPRSASRPHRRHDLLKTPLVGRLLRSLAFRRAVQWLMLAAAAAVILDGLLGPRLSPMNLAGILPWTHWRGFVVIALLVAGNAFCWTCPFMLPRELGKRLFNPVRSWPRVLRSKWLAAALLLTYLWAYEVFSLWDSPWWTAWVVLGYFGLAALIDAIFRGAAFCKWVCPIGQFHFIESMASPREVAAVDQAVCDTCHTRDCIRGGSGGRGCELDLYLPTKHGNLDCTWCMDCVRACPHDNVGVLTRSLPDDVVFGGWRGGLGRLSGRRDLAALATLLTFGAFANAMGMVGPILEFEDRIAASLGLTTSLVPATIVLLAVAVVAPALLLPLLASVTRRIGAAQASTTELACRLAFALVPIGFAMWVVHMLFHFFTSLGTIVPVTQRVAIDVGGNLGEPAWILACCLNIPAWLLPLELLLLDVGLVLAVVAVHKLAYATARGRVPLMTAVMSLPAFLLFVLGVWIVLQPMQMRGTILP
ncbi:MAG: cytochrome c oxidase assembly protein [Phycisphaerales bacterium]|jgi:cytochrome c oxidase assembly factor CtaG|nr:cytochrome c oxidase assembly protein [Phycisphaerales bacterium]